MAQSLNKSRMLNSKIALLGAFFLILFSRQFWENETPLHEFLDYGGYFLVALCALGRVYTTAFLGGFKNEDLITYGPFSIVRNPLYFFSLIGITGIALISNHLVVIIGLPLFFIILYYFLIQREEAFLEQVFGENYRAYKARVPRFVPNVSLYEAPETVQMSPRYINKALKDALWWFAPFPFIELVEYLQETNMLPILFHS